MSVAAGRTFIAAVNKYKAQFKADVKPFYDKFIAGKQKPSDDDVAELAAILAAAHATAKFYHDDVARATQGFGGAQDMTFHSQDTLLDTLKKKAAAP